MTSRASSRSRRSRPITATSAARSTTVATPLLALALVTLTLVTFSSVGGFDFVNYDDPDYVSANPHVAAGLTGPSVRWAMTSTDAANWHPLTWLSHMLDVEMWGLASGGHHWTSVALHALTAVLLFVVLRRLTAAAGRSAFVAALFAVHPLHVESVAWISERKDVLSGLLWVLCLLAYVRYVQRPSLSRYLVVFAALAAGLAAKPMLVTLPAILLLIDYWPLGRVAPGHPFSSRAWTPLVVEKLPLLALSAASAIVTVMAQHSVEAIRDVEAVHLSTRVANAITSYWLYLVKTVWPVDLSPYYPYPTSIPTVIVVAAAMALAGVTFLVVSLRARAPYSVVGWLWYLISLLPVIGLIQVGSQAMADRYTYLPLIGIFMLIAWGVADVATRRHVAPVVLGTAAVAVVLLLAIQARAQAHIWRDSVSLWTHALAVTPDNYFAHGALGAALLARADPTARQHLEAALTLRPDLADVHNDLGTLLTTRGEIDAGRRHLEDAVRLQPRFAEAHHNLGVALDRSGQSAAAIDHFQTALTINPALARTHNALGKLLAMGGDAASALSHFNDAIRLSPDVSEVHHNAGLALATLGRHQDAILAFQEAVRLKPGSIESRHLLAVTLYREGRTADAARELRAILALDPQHAPSRAILSKMEGTGR